MGVVVTRSGFEPPTPRFVTLQLSLPHPPWKCSCAGLSLHHTNRAVGLDATRQVSTPSPFGAWLGIAILQVSPNLSGSTRDISLAAPNYLGILYSIQLSYRATIL